VERLHLLLVDALHVELERIKEAVFAFPQNSVVCIHSSLVSREYNKKATCSLASIFRFCEKSIDGNINVRLTMGPLGRCVEDLALIVKVLTD
jgi:hypothetical protein